VGCGQCQGLSLLLIFLLCLFFLSTSEFNVVNCNAGFTSGLVDHPPMCLRYLFHGCHVFAGNVICL
jgi:hypothetical protein